MKLLNVQLHNFLSYKDLSFDIPDKGFYFFTGFNEADPKLTTNGIGKSTLMDAIFWCLYKKTGKNESAGDLLNNSPTTKGGYWVKLTFDTCVVERGWKPNYFRIDGVDCDDKDIKKVLPLTAAQFLRSVYFVQKGDYFLDMTPGAKLEFLSNLFQLDEWLKASELAKTEAQKKNTEQNQLNYSIDSSKNQIENIKESQADIAVKSANWKQTVAEEIKTLEASLNDFEKQVLPLPDDSEISARIAVLTAEIASLNSLDKEVKDEEIALKQEIAIAQSKIDDLKNSVETWLDPDNDGPDLCPTCGQEITKTCLEQTTEDLTARIAEQEVAIVSAEDALKELLSQREESIEAPRIEMQTELNALTLELNRINQEKQAQSYINQNINRTQIEIANKKNAVNPFDGLKESTDKQIEALEINITRLSAQLNKVIDDQVKLEQWEKHFKLLRLWILDDVINQLEVAFNHTLSNMGFEDAWEIKLETEKALKTKETVKKEIHVRVFRNGVEKRYAGLSGGEQTRLQLASTLGISDLILGLEDVDPNFRMFDETGTGLSEEGVSDLLSVLAYLGEFKAVFMADHRIFEKSHFTHVYRIIKDVEGVSRIVD